MRVGTCILPRYRWPEARARWRTAEELGFHSGWTYDHLTWRHLRDGPWFEAMSTLAAVAAVTERIRLGPMVASPNFRHPVTFAKEVMTLDDVSGGRVDVGIGAGGVGWDATALGQDPWPRAERTARFVEFVDHLDVLLREPEVDRLDGRYYRAVDARAVPGCVQRPRVPFVVAGAGPRALAVAARHGQAWVTYGDVARSAELDADECVDVARAQAAALDDACAAAGRDPATIDRVYLQGQTAETWLASTDAFDDLAGRYAAAGFTDVILHWSDDPAEARVLEHAAATSGHP